MVRLLAESYRLDPGLPPWITAAMILAWLVVVGGAVAIFLYRRAVRREQQRTSRVRVAEPELPELGPAPTSPDVQNDPL